MSEASGDREKNQETTVLKSDIAKAIENTAKERNVTRKHKRYIDSGFLIAQVNKAAKELAENLPGVYEGLSEKRRHNEAEAHAILDRLIINIDRNDKHGDKDIYDTDLMKEVFTKLFPPQSSEE